MSCRQTADPISIQFRMKTRVGPRDQVLCGGPDSPKEKAIGELFPPSKMHYFSESVENGCINNTIYTPTDSVRPQKYTSVSFTDRPTHVHLRENAV